MPLLCGSRQLKALQNWPWLARKQPPIRDGDRRAERRNSEAEMDRRPLRIVLLADGVSQMAQQISREVAR
ncbi:MAG: hypothetical protein PVG91_03190 [Gammaproteobacteria bacterium]|jgi:hypothetical protein